jgi:hypothetical protein
MDAIVAFADHVVRTRFQDLPSDAIKAAKIFILDTFGVGTAGSSGPMACDLADMQETWGRGEEARVWGNGKRLPAPAAAMCNAYQAHNSEFDCLHEEAVVHAMTVVLPVAIAGAEPILATLDRDVRRLARLRRVASWVSRDASSGADLASIALEYLNTIFLFDANAAYFGGRELRERSSELLRVIDAVGDVDAALSVASFRAGHDVWTRPVRLAPGSPVTLCDVRHLLVRDAIPNSIALAPPHGVIITGSNMSGKSTFLRTVGTAMVMAQTINTCAASRYEAPLFVVRSCIGRNDDIVAGKSYYIVEVESVLALVRAGETGDAHLFLFDELFRGTNAVERIAAGEAVLAQIAKTRDGRPSPHIVIAATHDHELVDLLRETHEPYHFTDTVGPEGLTFEYKLEPGPATTRNAITLLELNGAPPELVERALRRAVLLDEERREVMSAVSPGASEGS